MVEIVEYTEKYREVVNKIMYDIMVEEYGFTDFSKEILEATNEEYLMEENKLWLAKIEEEFIGTMGIIKIDEENALLKKVYVKEEYRGNGLSQQLFDLCLEYALKNNYRFVQLGTYERLTRARNFYTKNGFYEYKGDFPKTRDDEIRFLLDLSQYAKNKQLENV